MSQNQVKDHVVSTLGGVWIIEMRQGDTILGRGSGDNRELAQYNARMNSGMKANRYIVKEGNFPDFQYYFQVYDIVTGRKFKACSASNEKEKAWEAVERCLPRAYFK